MTFQIKMRIETKNAGKKFWFKLKLSLSIVASWWFVYFIELLFNLNLHSFGLKPHDFTNLKGILTYPFIHGNFEHLSNNSLSGFIIFSSLFVVYEKISLKIIVLIYILSGMLLWLIGESYSTHIGASSIIYGVAFFLFFSGIITYKSSNITVSLLMAVWYGSMIWGINPLTVESGVSWEGHLSGAIIGIILAILFHRDYLNKKNIDDEEEDEEYHFYEKYPLEEISDFKFEIFS